MKGTVGSNSFSDCTGNVTLTNVSSPAVQSAGVFNQSGYFSAGYLSANSQSAIALGSSDFTVEFWLKPTSGSSPGLIINGSAQTSGYAAVAVSESGVVTFSTNGTSWASTTNLSLTNSVWSHIAISRYGSTIGVFKNGTAVGSYTVGDGISLYAGTYNSIGAYAGSSTGYMDELRLVKGTGKYTGTFAQPYAEFGTDPCSGTSPVPGTLCSSGSLYLGSLSPGALSGSGTDKYMTTPGGCGEIPTAQKTVGINAGAGDYPNGLFTPTCSGSTDALTKYWNDGSTNWYVVPGLVDYTTSAATDQNYGSTNTTNIVAITTAGQGGYHAAARYCKSLNYGGYTDWYLPSRAEINLMYTGYSSIQGLNSTFYWSSTEYNNTYPWAQRPSDGNRTATLSKNATYLVRCVRKY